jgi:predicted ATPase
MMTTLAISGYRSLRDIKVSLAGLTIVTGANGSGKSSLYRALKLLADIAQGRIVQSLAAEGGLQSTLWAGPEAFSRAMKAGSQPVQGLVRKNPSASSLDSPARITAMPSISGCRCRMQHRDSRATRRSKPKACGPANNWAGRTPSRCATVQAYAFETAMANGDRRIRRWRRSTA